MSHAETNYQLAAFRAHQATKTGKKDLMKATAEQERIARAALPRGDGWLNRPSTGASK